MLLPATARAPTRAMEPRMQAMEHRLRPLRADTELALTAQAKMQPQLTAQLNEIRTELRARRATVRRPQVRLLLPAAAMASPRVRRPVMERAAIRLPARRIRV